MNTFGNYVLWYLAGILCLIAALGYLLLDYLSKKRFKTPKVEVSNVSEVRSIELKEKISDL